MLNQIEKDKINAMESYELRALIADLDKLLKQIPRGPVRVAVWHYNRQRHRYAFMLKRWTERDSDDQYKNPADGKPITSLDELSAVFDWEEAEYQKKQEAFNKRKK